MGNVKLKRVGSSENAENEDGGSDKGLQGTAKSCKRKRKFPPLTPQLFSMTLKYSVPEDRGEPESLNTSTAELPQSVGPREEMQLSLK